MLGAYRFTYASYIRPIMLTDRVAVQAEAAIIANAVGVSGSLRRER